MANNPLDRVYLSETQLNSLVNGGNIIDGNDVYYSDEDTLYLTNDTSVEDVKIDNTSIKDINFVAQINTKNSNYNASSNKLLTESDITNKLEATSLKTVNNENLVGSGNIDFNYKIVTSTPNESNLGDIIYEKTSTPSYTFNLSKVNHSNGTEGQKWYSSYTYQAETYKTYTFSDGTNNVYSYTTFSENLTKTTGVVFVPNYFVITESNGTITLSNGFYTYTSTTENDVTTIEIDGVTYTITSEEKTSPFAGTHTLNYTFWGFDFKPTSTASISFDLNNTSDTLSLTYDSTNDNFSASTNILSVTLSSPVGLNECGQITITLKDNESTYSSLKINSITIDSKIVYNNGALDTLHAQNLKISNGTAFNSILDVFGVDFSFDDGILTISLNNGG